VCSTRAWLAGASGPWARNETKPTAPASDQSPVATIRRTISVVSTPDSSHSVISPVGSDRDVPTSDPRYPHTSVDAADGRRAYEIRAPMADLRSATFRHSPPPCVAAPGGLDGPPLRPGMEPGAPRRRRIAELGLTERRRSRTDRAWGHHTAQVLKSGKPRRDIRAAVAVDQRRSRLLATTVHAPLASG